MKFTYKFIGWFLLLCTVGLNVEAASDKKNSIDLVIDGYPFPYAFQTSSFSALGDDPLIGNLACPALIRLNLLKRTNELVLLSGLTEKKQNGKTLWEFMLKPGVTWWDNTSVTLNDLTEFIQGNFREIVTQHLGASAEIPKYDIKEKKDRIQITWSDEPAFGPYVLTGMPFYKNSRRDPMCTGDYRWQRLRKGGLLTSLRAKTNPKKIRVYFGKERHKKVETPRISFRTPADFSGTPWTRMSDEPVKCQRRVDLPTITLLSWNPNSRLMRNPAKRRLITELLPRGELLRAGSAYLGDLISGPILRAHPGYNRSVKVPRFLPTKAKQTWASLRDKNEDNGNRPTTPDVTDKLRIKVDGPKENLLTKVISDSLASADIEVEFVAWNQANDPVDGVLASVQLPWPGLNFLGDFASKASSGDVFFSQSSATLDEHLTNYALSLTQKSPDFSILRKIHKVLSDLEPSSMLLQHRICLEANQKFQHDIGPVVLRNPDWMRKVIGGQ